MWCLLAVAGMSMLSRVLGRERGEEEEVKSYTQTDKTDVYLLSSLQAI